MVRTPSAHAPPRLFKWFEPDSIAASGLPDSPDELAYVADEGIKRIVSVTQTTPDYGTIAGLGMSVVHSPGVTGDLEALDRAVEAVHAAVTDGDKVLVH
ncbi:MAG: hypothetical protein CL878_15895 [Dehalococcoidia bacterium]|nr:hypothetical protein [Dehalococcoidia bacterium]